MGLNDDIPILRKDSEDTEFTAGKIFLIVFMSVMNVFMFLGNSLSIATICSTESLRKQVSYWFVLNLAVIDLIISLTVVPLNIAWEYYGVWPFNKPGCDFFTFADIAFSTISAYSIVLVSIDKYLFISYSLHYFDKMTRKIALILIMSVWIFVSVFATISVLTSLGTSDDYQDHYLASSNGTLTCIFLMTDTFVIPSALICFFIPFFILCFSSVKIVCIAVKHIRKIKDISNSITSETESEMNMSLRNKQKPRSHSVPYQTKTYEDYIPRSRGLSIPLHSTGVLNPTKPLQDNLSVNGTSQPLNSTMNTALCASPIPETVETEHDKPKDATDNKDNLSIYTIKPSTESFDSKGTVTNVKAIENGVYSYTKTANNKSSTKSKEMVSNKQHSNLRQTDSLRSVMRKKSPYCKLFGTVTIVIACFVFMFAPYYIATVIDVSCHCIQAWIYEDILAVLYYMHSLVNPFIYIATDRKFKAALKLLHKKICIT